MTIGRSHGSTLYLQMGQEVMYLLLVTSLICNFVLAALAMRSSRHATELSAARPYSEMLRENRQLQRERATLQAQIKDLRDALERTKGEQAKLAARNQELEAAAKRSESERTQAASRQQQAEDKFKKLEAERAQQNARMSNFEAAARQRSGPQDQPPIITLRETDGFSFPPGSADLSDQFLDKLTRDVVPKLSALGERYAAQIVEVIGHTDGTSIRDTLRIKANLDDSLGQYLDPMSAIAVFPFDNVGLGISRAVSVARALRSSGLPATLSIHPLSAAYLISPDERPNAAPRRVSDPSRRRIEIRLRRVDAN